MYGVVFASRSVSLRHQFIFLFAIRNKKLNEYRSILRSAAMDYGHPLAHLPAPRPRGMQPQDFPVQQEDYRPYPRDTQGDRAPARSDGAPYMSRGRATYSRSGFPGRGGNVLPAGRGQGQFVPRQQLPPEQPSIVQTAFKSTGLAEHTSHNIVKTQHVFMQLDPNMPSRCVCCGLLERDLAQCQGISQLIEQHIRESSGQGQAQQGNNEHQPEQI